MPSTIYLVTGGTRSGKSSHAERLCKSLCQNPIYLATATKWDDDFEQRIQRHQQDRGDCWTTIEEPLHPSRYSDQFAGRVVLVDCLTLWLTNYMMQAGAFSIENDDTQTSTTDTKTQQQAAERALTQIKAEFDKLTQPWNATFVFVTNELGSGTHASTHMTRKFVDAQGWFNQHVAQQAQRVVHMVSGIPNVIKDELVNSPLPCNKQARDEAIMLDKFLSTRKLAMDEKGYFLVKVDQGRIVASFHSCILNDKGEVCDLQGNKIPCHGATNRPEPMMVWKCRTAKELTSEIFERWGPASDLISVGHAAYIGREAQKAEYCLYESGETYKQD